MPLAAVESGGIYIRPTLNLKLEDFKFKLEARVTVMHDATATQVLPVTD